MSQHILFLCPHGIQKSVIAAAYATKLAQAAGMESSFSNAGTEPDEAIPERVIALLASDGMDVRGWQPRTVSAADLEGASRVISLGCDLNALGVPANKSEDWDVPSPGEDLIACCNAIQERVQGLIAELDGTKLCPSRFVLIPGSTDFDHGAFDAVTKRVFLAHTGANTLEILDDETGAHLETLPGFGEAAGVVVAGNTVLVTNRGTAELAVVDAVSLKVTSRIPVGPRPNGVAIALRSHLAVVACIGNETTLPSLECLHLETLDRHSLTLPGRPRWCVLSQDESQVFLAVRNPSMVLVADLPDLSNVRHWPLPSFGAHGIDIDHDRQRLFVACDAGELIAVSSRDGTILGRWALPGSPDATFFNPDSGLVHVAVGKPGAVVTINPNTGATSSFESELDAGTTALVRPDRLYVFLAARGGALELLEVAAA